MKTIVSALIAVSVLAGIAAAPAAAFDAKSFFAQQEREVPLGRSPAHSRRIAMKTFVSALLALSVLAGIAAAPASAEQFDAKRFWQEHQSY